MTEAKETYRTGLFEKDLLFEGIRDDAPGFAEVTPMMSPDEKPIGK